MSAKTIRAQLYTLNACITAPTFSREGRAKAAKKMLRIRDKSRQCWEHYGLPDNTSIQIQRAILFMDPLVEPKPAQPEPVKKQSLARRILVSIFNAIDSALPST